MSNSRARCCLWTVAILVAATGAMPLPLPARAAVGGVRYVSILGSDTAGGDCSESSRPCATVQHALDEAVSGDTVLVSAGTYREALSTRFGSPLVASVKGGWDSGYQAQTGTTTLDAAGRSSPIGTGEVLRLLDPGDDITVDKLTLIGGHGNGGAFGVVKNKLTVTRSVLTRNRGSSGGGIFNSGGTVTVTDSRIVNNAASDSGGGIANLGGGHLVLTRTTVSDNHVDAGRFDGGAIINIGTTAIDDSTLSGNSAREGGAIRNGGTLTVTDTVISGNTASLTGGGLMVVGGGVSILRTAIINNRAATEGGGYYAFGGNQPGHRITNTTISGNSADRGGGLWLHGGTIALSSSTVTANTATVGGGLYAEGGYILQNALIASNNADNGPDCAHISLSPGSGYSLIGNTTGCSYQPQQGDLVNVDPGLGPVASGVQTLTADSPAINAGNPAAPGSGGAACPADDQRGLPRRDRCDIGAYELVDSIAPYVDGKADRPPNDADWYNAPVTISWMATDPSPSSGTPTTPSPTIVSTEGAGQVVTSEPSCDPAGNCATGTVVVSIDKTKPTINAARTPTNSAGWNNGDVTVTFTCTDQLSGIASCTGPVVLTGEGTGQTASGTATDRANNTASATVSGINIDKAPPALGTPSWTTNPKPVGTTTAPVSTGLTVPAADTLSGLQGGEYFIGTDPGPGQGTAMTYANGSLTATLGAGLAVGVYDIGVRGTDAAGNRSPVTRTMLVVYDPAAPGMTGKNNKDLIPSLANGDIMPGLTQNSQTDPADYGFTIDYRDGSLDPRNDFHLTYATGTHCNNPNPISCHQLTLDATAFQWLVIDGTNNSRGRFQGTATVTVDGVTTTNPFTVEGVDGDRRTPTTDDHITIKIYAPGADPTTAPPRYQASGSITKGNAVRIR